MNVPLITIPNFRPKCSKSIPVFRPKRLKTHTLWGGTYLYTWYGGVPPGCYVHRFFSVKCIHVTKKCRAVMQSALLRVNTVGRPVKISMLAFHVVQHRKLNLTWYWPNTKCKQVGIKSNICMFFDLRTREIRWHAIIRECCQANKIDFQYPGKSTLRGNQDQFELAGVQVILVDWISNLPC